MRWERELESLRQQGLHRQLRRMESGSSAYVRVDGKKVLMCASNNYLGLCDHPAMIQAACEATHAYGTGSSGSRLTTGNTVLHEQLEHRIAAFKQVEAALVLSSGYMTNIAALSALVDSGDVILSDERNHASLIDGCRLSKAVTMIYRHGDMADLETKLKETEHARQRLIVTDGVFSMDGDTAPLADITALARRYDAMVMVDDAHGTGVLGELGRGAPEHCGVHDQIDVHIGTLSKAIGAEGGYIAGCRSMIDFLRNKARPFMFSTSLSPGVIASALCAFDLIEAEPERRIRVLQLANDLRRKLQHFKLSVPDGVTPIIPVIIGGADDAVAFSRALEAHGIFAPAIRPPTVPTGSSRIRLTVMANHSNENIEYIAQTFTKVASLTGVIA